MVQLSAFDRSLCLVSDSHPVLFMFKCMNHSGCINGSSNLDCSINNSRRRDFSVSSVRLCSWRSIRQWCVLWTFLMLWFDDKTSRSVPFLSFNKSCGWVFFCCIIWWIVGLLIVNILTLFRLYNVVCEAVFLATKRFAGRDLNSAIVLVAERRGFGLKGNDLWNWALWNRFKCSYGLDGIYWNEWTQYLVFVLKMLLLCIWLIWKNDQC